MGDFSLAAISSAGRRAIGAASRRLLAGPRDEVKRVVADFGRHINPNGHQFLRTTWEDAYRFVKSSARADADCEAFLKYIEGKSVGYNGMKKLAPAFSVGS